MLPDFHQITEMTLYSFGFEESHLLARRIVHSYKLFSEQFTLQPHYDYSMRSLKCVLTLTRKMKWLENDLSEWEIVLKAIKDIHFPKLIDQDVPMFECILSELFPGILLTQTNHHEINKWINMQLEKKKLQAMPWFVEKITQLYEMMSVRHGVMIVGETMSGKTTVWKTLAEALKDIKNDQSSEMKEHEVDYRIINPKSVSIGELYGRIDVDSQEWVDGVLAKTFREMATTSLDNRSWIILDGPVDPTWIENLNTLLDDNRKMCLNSGEMIEKSKLQTMLFETVDLEQASPATVSRCGIVFMDSKQMGWKALHKSFLIELKLFGLNEIYLALFDSLSEWLFPAALDILKGCRPYLSVPPTQKYKVCYAISLREKYL